jgi:malic enzyme
MTDLSTKTIVITKLPIKSSKLMHKQSPIGMSLSNPSAPAIPEIDPETKKANRKRNIL